MALHEFNYEKEATVSIVKSILTDAIKMKASDIHFDPEPNKLVIRFRINGDLVEYTTAPENVKTNILTRIKILSGMNITEAIIPQIGAINFELSSRTHNMRTATIPVVDGEKIVVHLSNYARNLKSLDSLGFEKENIDKIMTMLNDSDGIILITGTNSSGKTTSMYAILQELSKKPVNIISVENPIKMKLPKVNQVQINNERGITYNSILKSILLSDPDVIAINELIDDETVRTALRSSISGHLVISTMHTKTAFTTIKSLLNMDVENYLLGSNLDGIISQRLVKKLCPTCREKKQASEYEKKIIKEVLGEEVEEIYVPKGCEECQDGYIDQLPVVEVVNISDELRQAISNHRNEDLIYNIIYSENESIVKDAFKKVVNGDTSFEEAVKAIDVKTDLGCDDKKIKDLLLGKEVDDDDTQINDEHKEDEEKVDKKEKVDKEEKVNKEKKDIVTKEKTEEGSDKEKKDKETNDNKNDINDKEKDKDNKKEEKKDDSEKIQEEPVIDNKEEKHDEQQDKPQEEKKEQQEKNIENKEEIKQEKDNAIDQEKKEETAKEKDLINDNELLQQALKLIEKQLLAKKEETKEKTVTESEPTPITVKNEEQKVEEVKVEEPKDEGIKVEDIKVEEIAPTPAPEPTPIVIQKDDDDNDDDDDSFSYDNSYVNNF